MSYPRKLTDEQVADLALYAMRKQGHRWPEPVKRTAHRYGVGHTTMSRYLKQARAQA